VKYRNKEKAVNLTSQLFYIKVKGDFALMINLFYILIVT
jgi:hypothetical protein